MQPIKIGLIGGSGLGDALGARENGTPQYVNTPFGKPSGTIIQTHWSGVPILILGRHGNGHVLSPSTVPYRANIYALKMLGCTHILATGAVGSLREDIRPRDVVVPDQVIDKTTNRESTFFEHAAVHVEFAEPFCPVLRKILMDAAPQAIAQRAAENVQREATPVQADAANTATVPVAADPMHVHTHGCYIAMEGPAFSTRAESLMHRLWGGDLIGMTAMPEAKLAREAELPYALIALVTDYDSWRNAMPGLKAKTEKEAAMLPPPTPRHELLNEIIANLKVASENTVALIKAAVERIAREPSLLDGCPATTALELAIWSNKEKLSHDEIERLWPLWGHYFPRL